MTRTIKIALGAATIWPLVYMVLFMGFVFSMFFSLSHDASSAHMSAGEESAFFRFFALHLLTIFEMMVLLVFYIVDAFRNSRIAQDQRIMWAILIFVGGPIAMAVYWYLNIWRTAPALTQRPLEQS